MFAIENRIIMKLCSDENHNSFKEVNEKKRGL